MAMLQAEEDENKHKEYIATVLWSIGRIVGGENYPIPSYSDYIDPKPVDNRSSQEIRNGLIAKLEGKGENADASD